MPLHGSGVHPRQLGPAALVRSFGHIAVGNLLAAFAKLKHRRHPNIFHTLQLVETLPDTL